MINYVPAMVIPYNEFRKKLNGDLLQFAKELEEIRKQLKEVSGYFYDNHVCRFSNIFGTEFKFMLYDNYLSVWDYTGGTLIVEGRVPDENRWDFINNIILMSEQWTKGYIQCSNCRTMIKYLDNIGHRFYAGTYCDKCWDGKWRTVESEENYD